MMSCVILSLTCSARFLCLKIRCGHQACYERIAARGSDDRVQTDRDQIRVNRFVKPRESCLHRLFEFPAVIISNSILLCLKNPQDSANYGQNSLVTACTPNSPTSKFFYLFCFASCFLQRSFSLKVCPFGLGGSNAIFPVVIFNFKDR